MIPILHTALLKCNCRTCLRDFDITATPKEPVDIIDIKLLAHEALENAGWADSQCPSCLERSRDEMLREDLENVQAVAPAPLKPESTNDVVAG